MKKEKEDLNIKLKRQIISYEHLTQQSDKYEYCYPLSANTEKMLFSDDSYRQTIQINMWKSNKTDTDPNDT